MRHLHIQKSQKIPLTELNSIDSFFLSLFFKSYCRILLIRYCDKTELSLYNKCYLMEKKYIIGLWRQCVLRNPTSTIFQFIFILYFIYITYTCIMFYACFIYTKSYLLYIYIYVQTCFIYRNFALYVSFRDTLVYYGNWFAFPLFNLPQWSNANQICLFFCNVYWHFSSY